MAEDVISDFLRIYQKRFWKRLILTGVGGMSAQEIVKKVDRMMDVVDGPLIALGIISLVGSAALLFFGVIARYIFFQTFPVTEDLAINLIVWAVFLMGGPLFRQGGHIGMEFFAEKLTGFHKFLQQLILHLALLAACIILLWKGTEVVQLIYQVGKTTPSGELKQWYLMLAAPLGGALFGFYGIAGIIKVFCVWADPKLSEVVFRPRLGE